MNTFDPCQPLPDSPKPCESSFDSLRDCGRGTRPVKNEPPYSTHTILNFNPESEINEGSFNTKEEFLKKSFRVSPVERRGLKSNRNRYSILSDKMSIPPDLLPTAPRDYQPSFFSAKAQSSAHLDSVDVIHIRNLSPPQKAIPPKVVLHQKFTNIENCNPDVFQCTLNRVPDRKSLLLKTKLPFGLTIQPFRDLKALDVVQRSTIVRCRSCRTYINPFVTIFQSIWKCNLCESMNDIPYEFHHDSNDHQKMRPEIRNTTVEFIAPADYMLRPPQPAAYLFLLDISRYACENGYLETFVSILLDELNNLPGDSRTRFSVILFDSKIHFFYISEDNMNEMVVPDVDDIFLPSLDNLLVNLKEKKMVIIHLLKTIIKRYQSSYDVNCALGAALQGALKLLSPVGGRISLFLSCLPNVGPGALDPRLDNVIPQNDFYKKIALECCSNHITVDLFLLTSLHVDLATVGEVSKHSGGTVYYLFCYEKNNPSKDQMLANICRRYLKRNIGFEAVLRIRCSKGLAIRRFHGNFFMRSTDLLSLPNLNPDSSYGVEIAMQDDLSEHAFFQAAILYTTSNGERRIRVHTLCLPVTKNVFDVFLHANQKCILSLFSKMAVDKSLAYDLEDTKDSLINAVVDICSAYRYFLNPTTYSGLLLPKNLSFLPMFTLSLMKSFAFCRNLPLDLRTHACFELKTLPLATLVQFVHPDLYEIDTSLNVRSLLLTRRSITENYLYVLDKTNVCYLYIGKNFCRKALRDIFSVDTYEDIEELPIMNTDLNLKLRQFLNDLNEKKDISFNQIVYIIKDPLAWKQDLTADERSDLLSYYEFVSHIKAQVEK